MSLTVVVLSICLAISVVTFLVFFRRSRKFSRRLEEIELIRRENLVGDLELATCEQLQAELMNPSRARGIVIIEPYKGLKIKNAKPGDAVGVTIEACNLNPTDLFVYVRLASDLLAKELVKKGLELPEIKFRHDQS